MKNSNAVLRYEYRLYLGHAAGGDEKTIRAASRAIVELIEFLDEVPLCDITREHVIAFKARLDQRLSKRSDTELSPSTKLHILAALKKFFRWVGTQYQGTPIGRNYEKLVEYLTPANRIVESAKASQKLHSRPRIEQAVEMVRLMPSDTFEQRRDRGLLSFLIITGARIEAAVTLRLRHVDAEIRLVHQDGATVGTKFGKNITTAFIPIDAEIEGMFLEYYQERCRMAGADAPLFPCTAERFGKAEASDERFWKSQTPARRILKLVCGQAGVPYFAPHAFRHMLAEWAQKHCHTAEQRKAFSQNLGHDIEKTTWSVYAKISLERQIVCVQQLRPLGVTSRALAIAERYEAASDKDRQTILHVLGML